MVNLSPTFLIDSFHLVGTPIVLPAMNVRATVVESFLFGIICWLLEVWNPKGKCFFLAGNCTPEPEVFFTSSKVMMITTESNVRQ